MGERTLFYLALAAAIGTGLVGGIFYAFSSFVMTALGRISPEQGVTAMKSHQRGGDQPIVEQAKFLARKRLGVVVPPRALPFGDRQRGWLQARIHAARA